MKVAVIHGQSHKGSTYHITKLLVDELVKDKGEILEFQINSIKPCVGCNSCIIKDEGLCPQRSVVAPIIEAIELSDIIIAESPNYCMGMSGQLKTFFDHMGYRWITHRPHPSMKNKIGVAISTTAGVGASKTTKNIKQQLFWWGVAKTYRISVTVDALQWSDVKPDKKLAITKKIKKLAKKISKSRNKVKPGIKWRFLFNLMRVQQKGTAWNPIDRKYWEDNGWI